MQVRVIPAPPAAPRRRRPAFPFAALSGGTPGNASGACPAVSLAAIVATAIGAANATGAPPAVSLAGLSATATGGAGATGTAPAVSLGGITATATGAASASGTAPAVSLSAPAGIASGGGAGTASGTPGVVSLGAPAGIGTGAAVASGTAPSVSLAVPAGSASGGSAAGNASGTCPAVSLSAPAGAAASVAPPGSIDAGLWMLMWGAPGSGVAPPVGTGPTLVAAMIDAFENHPLTADFGGRISFDEEFPNTTYPYAELYEVQSRQEYESDDGYLEFKTFQLVVWCEEPRPTREFGHAARDLYDFCDLTFDDGYLILFERTSDQLVRDPTLDSRGSTRRFSFVITYSVIVGRNPT